MSEIASNREHPSRRWPLSSILWIAVLLIMASFQTWRGAYVDGLLFYALSGILIVDRLTGGRIVVFKRPLAAPRWVTLLVTGSLAAVFVLTPRHGLMGLVAIVAIGVTVFLLAWQPTPARPRIARAPMLRSAVVWAALAIAMLVLEAVVFVLSVTVPGGSVAFPTISVLLDPIMQNFAGRALVVALWLAGGLSLLGLWSKR